MKVKKIAALAVGAAMVGATLGAVSAQPEIGQLPAKDFFVKDGKPNVKIVVGSGAAAEDVVAAADIALAIGSLLYTEEEVKASATAVFTEILPKTLETVPVYSFAGNFTTETAAANALPNYWWNGADYAGTLDDWRNWWNTYDVKLDIGLREKILNEGDNPSSDWSDKLDDVNPNAYVSVIIDKIDINLGPDENEPEWPDGDETITVPAGAFQYIVDYWQWSSTTVVTVNIPDCCGLGGDYQEVTYYTLTDPGIEPGDSFTLLGHKYHVVCVYGTYTPGTPNLASICPTCEATKAGDYVLLLADQTIEGEEGWVQVGDSLTIGPYKITVVDISPTGDKVLLNVEDTTGQRPARQVTVALESTEIPQGVSVWGDYDGDGADDLVVALADSFIGLNTEPKVRLVAYTNLKAVNEGDAWPTADWTVHFMGLVDYNADGGWIQDTAAEGLLDTSDDTTTYETYYGFGWYTQNVANIINLPGTAYAKAVAKIKLVNADDIGGTTDIEIPTLDPIYRLHYAVDYCGGQCTVEGNDYYGQYVYNIYAEIQIQQIANPDIMKLEVGDKLDVNGDYVPDYELTSAEATVTTYKIVKPSEGITVLDTDIQIPDDVNSNLIVVGGPVINKVAAALAEAFGVPTTYDEWKSKYGTGKEAYVLKVAQIPGTDYEALLVAGTDREGTMEAAKYLLEYLANLS
ncbi:S-layer protein [Pyrococcus yayanosii]|uniref:S-layer protein, putative n=1 Tax=Pyrococcus yayanosii (strain CH1 / JCM 16557) TaxID=529709 RepID=F8AIU6_PYRYC|nr:S-layer protein [Pyrococcus yayanosii]AEH24421.1 S-layer protein, putative [Pyrococcus yayanosii CH1]